MTAVIPLQSIMGSDYENNDEGSKTSPERNMEEEALNE